MLPILGTTWFLGFLANLKHTEFFDYLFVSANCLQGAFVFLFHCLGNSEVRSELKRKWNQRILKNRVGVSEPSSSRHVTVKSTHIRLSTEIKPHLTSVVLSMGSLTASSHAMNGELMESTGI
ncbi:Adhesion G-protein coupled receptor D1 [Holothuria leucospilota]|uniref:Adhesion G-protein coupled receptor D1 n=1 Tax=Holothuria leucospilota TaxID=206669 RepID=A0A9Q1CLE4_HOLLE|nr:Adhesion G-protein coupled receptor D1 [Holothuria leucospilota]